MVTLTPTQVADLRRKADEQALDPMTTQQPFPDTTTPEERKAQLADLWRKIEARYSVEELAGELWCVVDTRSCSAVNDNDYDDPLDSEAEMEAIIQDEVKAAMEAAEVFVDGWELNR